MCGNNVSNIVDSTIPNTNAQESGIQANDKILKINGKTIHYKNDFDEIMTNSNGEEVEVLIERNSEEKVFFIKPMEEKYNYTGIAITTEGDFNTILVAVYPNSPASKAGFIEGNDRITAINGVEINNDAQKLVEEVNKNIGEKITFTVIRRGSETIQIEVMPEVKANYYMGVYLKQAENNFVNNVYYALFETRDFAFSIVDNLKLLFTGNVSINQMMGPIGIGEVVAETNGVADFVYILALISISLGFTNLLPFPPLDGGKIVILLIEGIRRKPLKEKTEMTIQMIGFTFLIGLSIIVAYNDVLRIF